MKGSLEYIVAQLHALASDRKPGELVRKHLYAPDIHLYVRLGPRLCAGRMLDSLVIASVEVNEDKQRQGLFTALLRRLETDVPSLDLQAVMVENIGNPHLRAYLQRIGYQSAGLHPDTLYKESPYE
jgi:predicted N-acetyltransferase YhbS